MTETTAPAAPAAPAAEAPAAPAVATPAPAAAPLRATMAERMAALSKGLGDIAAGQTPASPVATAAAVPPDAPTEPVKPPEEPQHKLLQRLAQMEREKRAVEEELKTLKPKASFEDDLRRQVKENPLEAAKRLGLSIEQMMDLSLNGGQPTPEAKQKAVEDELRRDIQQLKDIRAAEEKRAEAAAEGHARETFRTSVKEAAKPEAFPYLHALGDDAVDTVEEVFMAKVRAYGKTLGRNFMPEDGPAVQAIRDSALKETEAYYIRFRERLLTVGQQPVTIATTKADVPAPLSVAATPSQQSGQRRSPTTLTNSVSTSAPPASTRNLSMRERERVLAQGLSRLNPEE